MHSLPPKIKALVERCWAADPETRPEFEDIVTDLETIAKEIAPAHSEGKNAGGVPTECGCTVS